jgi:alkylation response protein AidB-like acyl-CoA dehydrogenase
MSSEGREQIELYRMTAQEMGDAALKAISAGDVGLARQAARQAAQYARVVVQLETGERWIEPEDEKNADAGFSGDSISVKGN